MISDTEMFVMVHRDVQQHYFFHQILNHSKVVQIHHIQQKIYTSTTSSGHSNANGSHSSSTTRSNNFTKRMSTTNCTQISSINENKVLIVFCDLFGLLGGVLFSWNFGKAFGTDTKQWRLFADCMNDIALTLELTTPSIAPLLSNYLNIKNGTSIIFLIMICVRSIFKSFCGMSEGATTVAICKYFGLKDTETDVLSKENFQKTFVTLMGIILRLLFTYTLRGEYEKDNNNNNKFKSVITIWFGLIILIHTISNLYAVKSLNLRTLNRERAIILISNYMLINTSETCQCVSEKETVWGIFHIEYFKNYLLCRWLRHLRGYYARSVYDDIYGDGKACMEFGASMYLATKDWISWNVQGLKSNNGKRRLRKQHNNKNSNSKNSNSISSNKNKNTSNSGANTVLISQSGEYLIYRESKGGVMVIIVNCSNCFYEYSDITTSSFIHQKMECQKVV